MVIHTERLTLRPWRETDAASLFTYASVLDVGPAAGWPPHRSIEESREIKYEEWLNRPVSWKLIQPLLNLFATLF